MGEGYKQCRVMGCSTQQQQNKEHDEAGEFLFIVLQGETSSERDNHNKTISAGHKRR